MRRCRRLNGASMLFIKRERPGLRVSLNGGDWRTGGREGKGWKDAWRKGGRERGTSEGGSERASEGERWDTRALTPTRMGGHVLLSHLEVARHLRQTVGYPYRISARSE